MFEKPETELVTPIEIRTSSPEIETRSLGSDALPIQTDSTPQEASKPAGMQGKEKEHALWSGQPDPRKVTYRDVVAVAMGVTIILTMFALLVMLPMSVSEDLSGTTRLISWAIQLAIVLPFMAFGSFLGLMPYLNFLHKKRTLFTVTNRRALTTTCNWRFKPVEYACELDRFAKITTLPGKKGSGTIVFDELSAPMKENLAAFGPQETRLLGTTLVFFDIANVDDVARIVESVITADAEICSQESRDQKQSDRSAMPIRRMAPGLWTGMYKVRLSAVAGLGALFLIGIGLIAFLIASVESTSYGYVDKSGNFLVQPQFLRAGNFREGLAPVCRPFVHDWGYVDKTGKMAINPTFVSAEQFSEGLAAVGTNDKEGFTKYGYIDHSGNFAIKPTFDRANDFFQGLAPVMVRTNSNDGFDEKWGFIDKRGQWKVKPQYPEVGKFVNGIAPAYVKTHDDSHSASPCLIDLSGKVVAMLNCGIDAGDPDHQLGFSDGLFLASGGESNDYGFISPQGKFVIPPKFEEGHNFSEGLAAVRINGKWGYLDTKGAWKIKPQFKNAKPFSFGVAPVDVDGKWGFIDRSGNLVIQPAYDDADSFSESLARVKTKDSYQLIDRSGQTVIKAKECGDMHDGLAAVAQ